MACIDHKFTNQHIRPEFITIFADEIGPFISCDQFEPLPRSRGGVIAIFVAKDICSKYVWFFPIKTTTAESYVSKLEQVIDFAQAHGKVVKVVLSDNAKKFVGEKWQAACQELDMEVRHITKYNLQSSPVKRTMKELDAMLQIYVNNFEEDYNADSAHIR